MPHYWSFIFMCFGLSVLFCKTFVRLFFGDLHDCFLAGISNYKAFNLPKCNCFGSWHWEKCSKGGHKWTALSCKDKIMEKEDERQQSNVKREEGLQIRVTARIIMFHRRLPFLVITLSASLPIKPSKTDPRRQEGGDPECLPLVQFPHISTGSEKK